jgi:hypothetical protein
MSFSLSIPSIPGLDTVVDAVGDAVGDAASWALHAALPDNVADGIELFAQHPTAGIDAGREVLDFRGDHPKAAAGVVELARGAKDRSAGATANKAIDLVVADPEGVVDLAGRAVHFTVDHEDAVRDAVRTYLGG